MSFGYTTKVGDTARQIRDTLRLAGRPIDLTDATVYFIMRGTTDETVYLEEEAVVVDSLKGKVLYKFQENQTKTSGMYHAEWRIVWDDGDSLTVPDDDHITLEIKKAVRKVGNL